MTRFLKIALLLITACLCLPSKVLGEARTPGAKTSPEIRGLLTMLDSLLVRTPEFIKEKEERISKLRRDYASASDVERRYWMASALYDEYCAYDSDSAMYYVDLAQQYARQMGRRDLIDEMELNRSYVCSATGLLDEANESLRKINPDSLPPTLALKYCDRVLFLSTHRDQYIGVERESEMYSKMVDSLLQVTSRHIKPDNPNYCWLMGWSNLNTKENARKAIPIVAKIVNSTDYNTRGNAMDAWVLSKLYERVGDEENRLKYLLLSAMADVRASNYKRRVRLGQLAKLQEKTLTAIHERIEHQADVNRIYLMVLAVFLVILVFAIFYIMRQNRLLRNSRATFNDANVELSRRVDELQAIREELNGQNRQVSRTVLWRDKRTVCQFRQGVPADLSGFCR